MKLYPWSVTGFVTTLLLFTSAVSAGEWGEPGDSNSTILASDFCASYNISGTVNSSGNLGGADGAMEPGDTFIFTATGNGTGSWRIVGDPGGNVTYTAGGTFPGTLTYEVPPGGQTAAGIGFYVDSYIGQGDTISGMCGDSLSAPVPSLSFWGQALAVMLIGLFGFAAFQRRRLR